MAPKKSKKSGPSEPRKGKKRVSSGKRPDKSPPAKRAKTDASTSKTTHPHQKGKGDATCSVAEGINVQVSATYNLKILSWNINGVRAWLEKGGLEFIQGEQPNVLCLQEVKCPEGKLPENIKNLNGYHGFWACAERDGYSGVGLLSKTKPINVTYGIGFEAHDKEGRVITAEFENYYVVTAYVPNSGRHLERLNYRMEWDRDFFTFLKTLSRSKSVILCGDLNVAHQEIDIANPSSNRRSAGFTQEERDSFGTLLNDGFIDTFRYLYPNVIGVYSFWTYMGSARSRNVGWRLDYCVCSRGLAGQIHDSRIHTHIMGSDHCPVSLLLEM